MPKLIVGNWKMHGEPTMARQLATAVCQAAARAPQHVQVVLCPPAVLLSQVVSQAQGTPVAVGGQDCHVQTCGAFTGDISASMLKSVGCEYVIVGHSERRAGHGETNEIVKTKAQRAIEAGLKPIICIGETLAEREGGWAPEAVAAQIRASLPATSHQPPATSHFLLAYEPVWAIGSGKTPSADDIVQMHAAIKATVAQKTGLSEAQVAVLYGGSVKPENAADILSLPEVSGVLVGGASVKAEEFCEIISSPS